MRIVNGGTIFLRDEPSKPIKQALAALVKMRGAGVACSENPWTGTENRMQAAHGMSG
jgi:hypothetical protein